MYDEQIIGRELLWSCVGTWMIS